MTIYRTPDDLLVCKNHGQLKEKEIQFRKVRTKFSKKVTQSCKICQKLSKKKRIKIPEDVKFRTCTKCNVDVGRLGYSDFEWYKPTPWCLVCKRKLQNEINKRKSEKGQTKVNKRRRRLKSNFGMTEKDYEDLLIAQAYVCAICKEPERTIICGEVIQLAVDHCHLSEQNGVMKVRGLLCRRCNHGLGYFRDSIDLIEEAAKYLTCDRI